MTVAPPATAVPSGLPDQVGRGNPLGTILGESTADPISFYGAAAVAQPTNATQAVLAASAGGVAATIASDVQSPSAVANITTAEKGLTLIGGGGPSFAVAAGDLCVVNKITSQAGLGVGNVRVSAAGQLGVTFSNFTAATLTPTASQSYAVMALRGLGNISATLTPTAIPPNTIAEQQFTVPGLRSDGIVMVSKPTAQTGLDIVGMRLVARNTLGISFVNVTAATITPTAAESYTVLAIGNLAAQNNEILIQETLSLTASANTVNSASQAATVTGLATTDAVVGVSKPTAQANFGIVGYFVSAANSLGITIANFAAATVTPTASDVYGIKIYRPAPAAPCKIYSQTLTPLAVAANTTAEQTFTVTGLVASSLAWVNKVTSFTNGLGIAGVRVSAADTLAINFCNVTAASITPPSEIYTIANFQVPKGDVGSEWVQAACLAVSGPQTLSNAMRRALVDLGLIAGA